MRIYQDAAGGFIYWDGEVKRRFATYMEALMESQDEVTTEWQRMADGLLIQLRAMLTGAVEVNEYFQANTVFAAILASLQADPTGAGLVEGTTYTAARAVALMALMSNIESFLGSPLTPPLDPATGQEIAGLPVPEISRRFAIRRTK